MKHETPNKKVIRLLTTVPRLFAVKVDGIWRLAYGVYIKPIQDPLVAKVIYNGREIIFPNSRYCKDCEGMDEMNAEENVISKNIATLPAPPPGPKLIYSQFRPRPVGTISSRWSSSFTEYLTPSYAEAASIQPTPVEPSNTMIVDGPDISGIASMPPPQNMTTERAAEIIEHFLNTGDERAFQSLEAERTPSENPLAS